MFVNNPSAFLTVWSTRYLNSVFLSELRPLCHAIEALSRLDHRQATVFRYVPGRIIIRIPRKFFPYDTTPQVY